MHAVVRNRTLRAVPLLALAFVGVPLAFAGFALAGAMNNSDGGPVDWAEVGGLVGTALAVELGLAGVLWYRGRYRPWQWGRRAFAVALVSGAAGFVVVAVASDADDQFVRYAFAALPSAVIVGPALTWLARRALTYPVLPELAQSRYEWVFPVRQHLFTWLVLGERSVRVNERDLLLFSLFGLFAGGTWINDSEGQRRPLSAVRGLDVVELGDGREAQLPPPLKPEVAPGPAIAVRFDGDQWVVPVHHADRVTQLIRARAGYVSRPA